MNPTTSRFCLAALDGARPSRLSRLTLGALVLFGLGASACGRGGPPASEEIGKAQSAVVTGTAPVLNTSAGTATFAALGGAIVVDPNLSLTISDGSDITGVQVSISSGYVTGQDVLGFVNQSGITGSFSSVTGVLTLSGSVPVSTYQAALRTVTYNNTAGASPNTQARQVTFSIGATSLSYGGHYYEFVATGLTWAGARTAAGARSYYGLAGYLATITSLGENSFVSAKLTATGWIGASDAATEGDWRWVTGPEGLENGGAGRPFWLGAGNGMSVNGQYSSWSSGEPNNYNNNEDYAQFYAGGAGTWNDLSGAEALGYVVEYGGSAGDPTPQVSSSKSLSVSIIPTYTLTASAGANGTVTPAGATTVQQGQSQSYTITPSASYTIASVLVDGTAVGTAGTYAFANVTANHTISATFAPPVIAVSAGNNQSTAVAAAFGTQLAVLVTKTGGTPLSGTSVTFTAPSSGAAATFTGAATTNASGIATITATANAVPGSYNVTATVTGTAVSTTFALRNLGAPSTISVVSGSGQSAAAQVAFGTALTVVVRDVTAFALPNVSVTFAAPASTGASAALSTTSATTNGAGQAAVTATAGTIAGAYSVTASAPGVATAASFALTNTAGAASAISVVSGSGQMATVAGAFAAPVVVLVTDAFANPVPGVTVTFAAPGSGASATFGTATPTTSASGLAQTTVTAGSGAGAYTVTASFGAGGGGSVSASLTNLAGAVTLIGIVGGSGQIAQTGQAFASPLSVRLVDTYGNPVSGRSVVFTATANSTTGASATLSTSSATDSAGTTSVVATANGLAGGYVVVASVAGGPAVASFTLTNQYPISVSPSSPTVAPLGSVTFVPAGGSGAGYVFAVQSAPSGGTIDPTSGVYTAGSTPLVTDIITLTDSQSHTATATIHVGPGLALSPSPSQVPPRGLATFTTAGGSGTGLVYAISTNQSGGTIDPSGHYVAGQNDSVTDIVMVTDSLGNTTTAAINVGVGITLTASATHTPPRGTLSFGASGGSGAGFVFALGANASGGTIDAVSGAYTAGVTPGVTDVVTVTDPLGNVAQSNIAVGPGISVSPAAPAVAPLGTLTLTAAGGSGSGYTFVLTTSPSGGAIAVASTGVYVAGATGNTTDLVTVTDSLGNTGTTSISVGNGIRVTPSSLATPPKGAQSFSVSGGSGTGYVFSLSTSASGGSIDPTTGAYTAGATGSTADVLSVVDSLGNHSTVAITVGPGLALTPSTVTVAPLGQQTFSLSGGTGSGYSFSLSSNRSGGSIVSLTGAYLAGGTGGVTDVITASDALGNTATASITVTAALVATADTLAAAPRASLTIQATGGAPSYVFSISSNGSGGTIVPSTGVYVAGAKPSSTDIITIADSNGASTNVIVNVGPGVAIAPAHPSVAPRGSLAFGATGGSGTGYAFAIADNKSGGTIVAATGAYTAGPTGDVADLVTVTDSLGNSTTVTVAVGGHLVLGPSGATVAPRQPLTVYGVAGSGTGYVYTFTTNVSGGTVDPATGAYVAGATANVADVLTVTDSLGNTATTTINVGPGLSVMPATAATAPRGTVAITSTGGSAMGYQFALGTNASGGSVSASGVYTAGAKGGTTDVVTVTDSLGNSATVTVGVGPAVTLTAGAAMVPPRGTTTFTAVGGVGGGYSFTLSTNGSGGNIVATTGVYTAGGNATSADVVQVTDPYGNTATLTVHVGVGVTITPASLAAPPRGALALGATGGSGTGYRFAFTSNASGGTLDATTGAYTAGSTTNVLDSVQVTDSLGNTATARIAVGGALTVNPALPMVAPREGVQLTAAGGSGAGFTFRLSTNASGGTVDATTGKYTAGAVGNVQDVVTVTDTLGNSAHATITVGDGLHIAPTTVETSPLAKVTFTVNGGSGEGYTFALTTNASNGAVDPLTGAYTAGAQGGGTDVVTVTDSLGNTVAATIQVGAALTVPTAAVAAIPRGVVQVTVTGGAAPFTYTLTTNGSGGSVNPMTGAYTAGTKGGTTDVITVRDANNATVTITVQVGPGVTITPFSGSAKAGQTVNLTATGGSGSGLHWTVVSSGSGGTVNSTTGVYTAGSHAGTDVIRVTDSLGNTADTSIPVLASSTSTPVNCTSSGCGCALAPPGGASAARLSTSAGLVLALLGLALARRRRGS